MSKLNIVMVEPEIPQNTGNVARTCAATGARRHLVGPMGFKIDDKKLKRAGLDYWQYLDITYYESLEEFFEKNAEEGDHREKAAFHASGFVPAAFLHLCQRAYHGTGRSGKAAPNAVSNAERL